MGYFAALFPPNASYSNNARNVNTDGSLNNNNAYNGNNGVRPAHAENRVTVGKKHRPKSAARTRNAYPAVKGKHKKGDACGGESGSRLHAPGHFNRSGK